MTKKEFIKIIKLVLFDDIEDGGFENFTTSDGTEWNVESTNYGDDDWFLTVDCDDGGYDPIQYNREDGTDDEIAEALVERLLYVGFEL